MIVLRATNLQWIKGAKDDPNDLCAHSPVEFAVGNHVFVKPADGEWTVSAAALYLLRTLFHSHDETNRVGEHLFPCCGHAMYDVPGDEDAVIVGCARGMDFDVSHRGNLVAISDKLGEKKQISNSEWTWAVMAFSDQVRDFYRECSPKELSDAEAAAGFAKFISEWDRRRFAVTH